jgi:glycosyltransferase involved in cell wall biosynthesis
MENALVSCLCVTRGKPDQLRRAISCFQGQSYQSRELIVLSEDDDERTEAVLDQVTPSDGRIRRIRIPSRPKLTLGQLRNLSIEGALGRFICQWDDDDWYHTDRIALQVQALESNASSACLLTNWLVFDEITRDAYFSHFRLWEGSLMCRRDLYTVGFSYPALSRSEDYVLVDQLMKGGHVFPLTFAGLYIYTTHSNNTWPRAHFEGIFSRSQKLSGKHAELLEQILAGTLSHAAASARLRDEEFLRELNYFPMPKSQSVPGE